MINKKTYNFTRILCDISDYVPDWGNNTAGELTNQLKLLLEPFATVELGMAKWQIDYEPCREEIITKLLESFKESHSRSEYYIK